MNTENQTPNTKNLKPFDLQAALNGEPVMLRDGKKGFVRHHETELLADYSTAIVGFRLRDDGSALLSSWNVDGRFFGDKFAHLDIIGMWPKTHMVNGFEVPAPETKALNDHVAYYIPSVFSEEYCVGITWGDYELSDKRALSRDLVFLNKEDAIANAKAMLGIDPYKKVEE